jgi:RNA-binding protein
MLSAAERKELKARAHQLEPIVMIGTKGLTDEVVKEVDVALKAHELIKVRAAGLEREQRDDALKALCQRTGAESVQSIGKVFVIYRKRDE